MACLGFARSLFLGRGGIDVTVYHKLGGVIPASEEGDDRAQAEGTGITQSEPSCVKERWMPRAPIVAG